MVCGFDNDTTTTIIANSIKQINQTDILINDISIVKFEEPILFCEPLIKKNIYEIYLNGLKELVKKHKFVLKRESEKFQNFEIVTLFVKKDKINDWDDETINTLRDYTDSFNFGVNGFIKPNSIEIKSFYLEI